MLTASLKAAEISAILILYESQVQSISTRILVQSSLTRWNNGNHSQAVLAPIGVCISKQLLPVLAALTM